MSARLVFLKLGGSLITVKNQPHTPRIDILDRLAREIADARRQNPNLRLLLGHGSGSFGHAVASKYHTRQGVRTTEDWIGFAEVWQEAAELNWLVMKAMDSAGLPARLFRPSAEVISQGGKVNIWRLSSLVNAIEDNLLPVIYGDVSFDKERGGTILSTEDLFTYLARQLLPNQILFAGLQAGVWQDFPVNKKLVPQITPLNFHEIEPKLADSADPDVTGGMADKVQQMMTLVGEIPGLSAAIFSGEVPGNVFQALMGEHLGTVIRGI